MIPAHATLLRSEVKDTSVLLTLAVPSAPTDPPAPHLTLEVSPEDGVDLVQFGRVVGPDGQPTEQFVLVFARHWWESYDERSGFGRTHYDWKTTLLASESVANACLKHWQEAWRRREDREAYELLKVRRVAGRLLLKVRVPGWARLQTRVVEPTRVVAPDSPEVLLFAKRATDGRRSLVFGYLDAQGQSEWTFTATGGQRVVARFMRHYDALMQQAERRAREDVQPVPLHSAAD